MWCRIGYGDMSSTANAKLSIFVRERQVTGIPLYAFVACVDGEVCARDFVCLARVSQYVGGRGTEDGYNASARWGLLKGLGCP